MTANNEIGVLQPIAEIGAIAKEKGILFHTDAVQAVGKVPFNVNEAKVDLVSISATRSTGRRASARCTCGAATRACCSPSRSDGGGHERGMRSGTLNVPGIVGLGKAAAIAQAEMATEGERLRPDARSAEQEAARELDELYINGSMEHRLPHNLNVSFAYVEGESLLMGINDVAVSSGSACTSASLEPSYVLEGAGRGRRPRALVDPLRPRPLDDRGGGRLRRGQADDGRRRLREMSPLYEMVKEGVDLSKMQWVTH